MAVIGLGVALLALPAAARSGHAQETEWPYRFIITGPEAASSGDVVAYIVNYERVGEGPSGNPAFVFTWNSAAAVLISAGFPVGPVGTVTEFNEPGMQDVGFAESAASGAVEFGLRLGDSFVGDFQVSMYVRGTGINIPDDSVTALTTVVTGGALSPASAPNTGSGGSGRSPGALTLAVATALAAALLTGAGLARRLR